MKVFFLKDFDPIKIAELENPRINFGGIQFANNSFRFLSGSLDGSTRIWSYVNMNWKCILLYDFILYLN
jgi:bromodomain and WD repeat domain containing protein 1/3